MKWLVTVYVVFSTHDTESYPYSVGLNLFSHYLRKTRAYTVCPYLPSVLTDKYGGLRAVVTVLVA